MATVAQIAGLIRWCCDEQARSQYLLELLERGKARTSADLGQGWNDTTAHSLAETRRKVDELGGLLRQLDEEYEKRRGLADASEPAPQTKQAKQQLSGRSGG